MAGTSAGTAVQGGGTSGNAKVPMIAGGESYEALVHPALDHICATRDCEDDLQYDIQGGLSLFSLGILDTHFSQRGRQGRLVRLASLFNLDFAFGVDETTGLIVSEGTDGTTNFEVIGWYGVSFFDLRKAQTGKSKDFSITGV